MPIIALFLLLFATFASGAAERELVYHLLSDRREADLNYALLAHLQQQERRAGQELESETPPERPTMFVSSSEIEPLFLEPVKGQHRVLMFCALEIGRYPEPMNGLMDFIAHHLLVLKTDNDNRILDGFYIIREWAEGPMLRMMLRFHGTERRLGKDFRLTTADFRQIGGDAPWHFNPTGRLDNLLNFKEAF